MAGKNKITVRLDDDIYAAISGHASRQKCSITRSTELLILKAIQSNKNTVKLKGKKVEDCLLEITINAAAAILELAREILSDSPGEYEQYQQAVIKRTKKGLRKFEKLINE